MNSQIKGQGEFSSYPETKGRKRVARALPWRSLLEEGVIEALVCLREDKEHFSPSNPAPLYWYILSSREFTHKRRQRQTMHFAGLKRGGSKKPKEDWPPNKGEGQRRTAARQSVLKECKSYKVTQSVTFQRLQGRKQKMRISPKPTGC